MMPNQYVEQVTNMFSQHRWARGKELLDKGLDYYPENAQLHYLAGRYWWNAKDYDQARYHLVKACQINYHFTDAKTLLVNIEEASGNYSSAICYVNELLEQNPYWKGLWQRKVDLYKKSGNFEEANSLLKRLSQIYPNDAALAGDYYEILETTYRQAKLRGDAVAAEEALAEMVNINPSDVDYQLAYANLLIRKGRVSDALDNLNAALNENPGNVPIITKTASILMDLGRNMGAITLVRDQMKERPSPELRKLYQSLLEESARIGSESDPYALYAKVFKEKHSMESLNYLVNESVRRGYYDEALSYLTQMKKIRGNSPGLVMLEYDVHTRMSQKEKAVKVLEAGEKAFPGSYDINLAISRIRMDYANELMQSGRYDGAVEPLTIVMDKCVEEELSVSAARKLYTCYRETRQFDKAAQVLRKRLEWEPEYRLTGEYASLLALKGDTPLALDVLSTGFDKAGNQEEKRYLASAYMELAYPWLREKLRNSDYEGVQEVCNTILRYSPSDYLALSYAMKVAPDPMPYVDSGMSAYPGDVSFPVKKAQILSAEGKHKAALDILEPLLPKYKSDESISATYAAISEAYAASLMKSRDYASARAVVDSALALRPLSSDLRYRSGLLYEKEKQWDSAYVYQSRYTPSAAETREYLAHLDALRARTLHNSVETGLDLMRFSDKQNYTAIASVAYTHSWKRDALELRVNYTARDAAYDEVLGTYTTAGGRGLQFKAQYSHDFGKVVSARIGGGYASMYFPKWVLDAAATVHLPYDWDVEAGVLYRGMQDKENMYAVLGGVSRGWEHFHAGASFNWGYFHKIQFFNASAKLRFYPIDGARSYFHVQAGLGSAPEISFLDYYYDTASYNHLNSFLAGGATWAVGYNFNIAASLTWNTLYDQRASIQYRNLFIANVSLSFSF